MTIPDRILSWARVRAEHPALIHQDQTITYGQLLQRVRRIMLQLSKTDIRPGDHVAICLKSDVDHLLGFLALSALGAVYIAMDWRATAAEKAVLISEFEISSILSTDDIEVPINVHIICLDTYVFSKSTDDEKLGKHSETGIAVTQDQPCIINVSSGTTGRPKGLMLSHGQYLARYETTRKALGWETAERYFSAAHLAFTAARNCCLFQLLSGNTVILNSPLFRTKELVEAVNETKATAIFLVPATARRLLALPKQDDLLLPNLRYLWLTGATLHEAEKQRLAREVNPNVYDEYGASGFGTISCLQPNEVPLHGGTVGRLASGIEAEIVDANHVPQATNRVGRLRCRGPGMVGEFTQSVIGGHEFFHDGWYYSGELAKFNTDGYLTLMGRASDIVNTGGINVDPEEVENVLLNHGAIVDAGVTSRPSAELGEQLAAFIVTQRPVQMAEIIHHCQQNLSGYKIPREFHQIAEIPRTIGGKVNRQRLSELLPAI